MTTEELQQAVNEYLEAHLDKAFWASKSGETQEASVRMATADILSELPGAPSLDQIPDAGNAVWAIAEQALFLARNYSAMTENRVISSESVEGISASYRPIGSGQGIGHRAEIFLKAARREMGRGSVRISRG
jgi:hypothetical protein